MPITEAFTATAALAAIFNGWFFLRALQQEKALKRSRENGSLRRIANAFVLVWLTILVTDLLVLTAGLGILTGFRVLGYLLALMPVGSFLAGFFALRGFFD